MGQIYWQRLLRDTVQMFDFCCVAGKQGQRLRKSNHKMETFDNRADRGPVQDAGTKMEKPKQGFCSSNH